MVIPSSPVCGLRPRIVNVMGGCVPLALFLGDSAAWLRLGAGAALGEKDTEINSA